ncbi:unnamed protein product [Sphagnum troendelagicum]|uniref:TMEM205-like domain-containing protein n=1 Tax=Sphagnum troendelagicum TaxID=128251 RepID=A0ABP0TUW1_9BRYO
MGATKVVLMVVVAGVLLLSLISSSVDLVLAVSPFSGGRGGDIGEGVEENVDDKLQVRVKEASVEPVRTAAEYARQTGEGIRHLAESALYRPFTDAVQALNRKTEQAVDSAKQTLLAGVSSGAAQGNEKQKAPAAPVKERFGGFWFRKKKAAETPKEHLDDAAASQGFQEHGDDTTSDEVKEEAMKDMAAAGGRRSRGAWLQEGGDHHHGFEIWPNTASSAKAQAHDSSATKATQHLKEGAENAAYESPRAAGKKTLGSGWDNTHDTTRDVMASRESAAMDSTMTRNRAYDKVVGRMVDKSEQAVKDAGLGILHTVNNAACKTADCLRQRAMEAGSFLPNVGQGIAYVQDKSSEALLLHAQGRDNFAGKKPHTWKRTILKRPVGLVLALARFLHLLTFATIYGSSLWVTFVSGIILSKNIPRQQFGFVQSRLFPVYLRVVAAGEGLLFLLHSIMHPWLSADTLERQQFQNFVWMIAATLVNVYVLEPRATKVMFERLKVEKEDGRMRETGNPAEAIAAASDDYKKNLTAMNERFKMLHSCSSAMNMITLAGLTWHLWHLSRRLII